MRSRTRRMNHVAIGNGERLYFGKLDSSPDYQNQEHDSACSGIDSPLVSCDCLFPEPVKKTQKQSWTVTYRLEKHM